MIYKKIEIKVDGYKETADLYTYFLDNSIEMNINRKRPVVVICPGGGYTMTSDREAEPIAMQYLAKGYHSVILRYSVEPAHTFCNSGFLSRRTPGSKSGCFLEEKFHCRNTWNRFRNGEAKRYDLKLSGNYFR